VTIPCPPSPWAILVTLMAYRKAPSQRQQRSAQAKKATAPIMPARRPHATLCVLAAPVKTDGKEPVLDAPGVKDEVAGAKVLAGPAPAPAPAPAPLPEPEPGCAPLPDSDEPDPEPAGVAAALGMGINPTSPPCGPGAPLPLPPAGEVGWAV
jgi:hypothetical protein